MIRSLNTRHLVFFFLFIYATIISAQEYVPNIDSARHAMVVAAREEAVDVRLVIAWVLPAGIASRGNLGFCPEFGRDATVSGEEDHAMSARHQFRSYRNLSGDVGWIARGESHGQRVGIGHSPRSDHLDVPEVVEMYDTNIVPLRFIQNDQAGDLVVFHHLQGLDRQLVLFHRLG